MTSEPCPAWTGSGLGYLYGTNTGMARGRYPNRCRPLQVQSKPYKCVHELPPGPQSEWINGLAERHASTWTHYRVLDERIQRAYWPLFEKLGSFQSLLSEEAPFLRAAESAWAKSSAMLAQTNDCLFDAGRGDLSKALSDRLLEVMSPLTVLSTSYPPISHTVPLQAYAVRVLHPTGSPCEPRYSTYVKAYVPPTTLRPIQMERDNMLQAPTFSKARFPRASLTNKFEIRESQNADSKKKWARAAGDPWEIELGEGLGWGVIIASKALIEIEAGCGMRQGSMVLKAGYLSLKVLHEVHRNHRTGVVRAAAAGMGKQEGPATERSTARLECRE
ncbi:hypothetical protein FA13DRAFT_1707046 [Coprinellus micaceus]|uniref:Uncharacterized protein n=1 Tax=Coprinellus micaceus TaxID=71717 RepID=A0A4Y7TLJ3_COPMI|nr:hypothetical protein FA13DRAFT_1707046 [Coprinellus micaceus]